MRKALAAVTVFLLSATAAFADPLTFTGGEAIFGPPPPGVPTTTIPGGTPVNTGNSYFVAAVPETNGGYISVGNLLSAAGATAGVRHRIAEGDALASAVTILPPNPGDRFAFNLSGATTGGRSAGSASGSYRVTDRALAFAAGSRSAHRTLAKGGVSFSFH